MVLRSIYFYKHTRITRSNSPYQAENTGGRQYGISWADSLISIAYVLVLC